MGNYYEMLKISPTSTQEEIGAAIDEQYNQWRKLVNHHDQNIVTQANQALNLLETMRTTLMDIDKRKVYDAAIGASGKTGGLADPSLLLHSLQPGGAVMAPPSIKGPAGQAAGQKEHNIWQCYQCKADNPPHSVHCFKCGAELMRTCPECRKVTSMVSTKTCGNCGYGYDVATQRAELQKNIQSLEKEIPSLEEKIQRRKDFFKLIFSLLTSTVFFLSLKPIAKMTNDLIVTLCGGLIIAIGISFIIWVKFKPNDSLKQDIIKKQETIKQLKFEYESLKK